MRKSIFIIAALIATTFANAQITLEHTFPDVILQIMTTGDDGSLSTPIQMPTLQAPYFYNYKEGHPGEGQGVSGYGTAENDKLELYDLETLNLYKTITLPGIMEGYRICYVTKNIFTTNGKVALIYGNKIVDEDGNIIFSFDTAPDNFQLIKVKGTYKLVVYTSWGHMGSNHSTYIYSLPGNGEASEDVVTPSSSKRNARKIARDGQVLVETENSTYTLQGQEVK